MKVWILLRRKEKFTQGLKRITRLFEGLLLPRDLPSFQNAVTNLIERYDLRRAHRRERGTREQTSF